MKTAAAFCPARVHGLHLHASNDAGRVLNQANGGRLVDTRHHEAPTFRPTFDIEPPARRTPRRWLPWVLLAFSLSLNVGLLARLAVIGGHL